MYEIEKLDVDSDDGTMVDNVEKLTNTVVGHKILFAEKVTDIPSIYSWQAPSAGIRITLDNGKIVYLADQYDCCAYTEVEDIILNLNNIEHAITGVGTTDSYTTWHIYADMGDVLKIKLDWTCGNPFYYAYGFVITVIDPEGENSVVPN